MTSRHQKTLFPVDKMAKMKAVKVLTSSSQTVDIDYKELSLEVVNGQLCFYYKSEDGDLILPIARKTTIDKLFENKMP